MQLRRGGAWLMVGLVTVLAAPAVIGQPGRELNPDEAKQPKDSKPAGMMRALPLDEALLKARVNGKYAMLLRQIRVDKDADPAKAVVDQGLRELTDYAGQSDLPKGYWVYVYPYWYVWRDLAAKPMEKRAWGPEQIVGPPDSMGPGDIQTAWASLSQDDQDEWLICEFAEPVLASAISIHETYNPGAVNQVSVFKLDGTEVEVWRGDDPSPADSGHGISIIPFKVDFKINRVKIYLASPAVPGWNEIDAVGLRNVEGNTQWASAVEASSTFAREASPSVPAFEPVANPALVERITQLETEVRQLKASLEDVKKLMCLSTEEIKDLIKKQQPSK